MGTCSRTIKGEPYFSLSSEVHLKVTSNSFWVFLSNVLDDPVQTNQKQSDTTSAWKHLGVLISEQSIERLEVIMPSYIPNWYMHINIDISCNCLLDINFKRIFNIIISDIIANTFLIYISIVDQFYISACRVKGSQSLSPSIRSCYNFVAYQIPKKVCY